MQVRDDGGAAVTASGYSVVDSGVDHDYDQEDAHDLVQPQIDIDEALTDTDEGCVQDHRSTSIELTMPQICRFRCILVPLINSIRGVETEGRLYPSYSKHEYGMPIDERARPQ